MTAKRMTTERQITNYKYPIPNTKPETRNLKLATK